MAQYNGHLTTEQLSASLDGQLSTTEQFSLDMHLRACEQCQEELTNLKHMAALLQTMPQPTLPRSFVLPLDTVIDEDVEEDEFVAENEDAAIHDADAIPVPLAAAATPPLRVIASQHETAPAQRRRLPVYVRTTLRALSALAAVLGLVLFLSGLPDIILRNVAETVTNSAPTLMEGRNGSDSASNEAYSPAAPAHPESTPEAASDQSATPASATPSSRDDNEGVTVKDAEDQPTTMSAPPPASAPAPPVILFFDLSTASGRLGFGFLLCLLGSMGFVVFKYRKRSP